MMFSVVILCHLASEKLRACHDKSRKIQMFYGSRMQLSYTSGVLASCNWLIYSLVVEWGCNT